MRWGVREKVAGRNAWCAETGGGWSLTSMKGIDQWGERLWSQRKPFKDTVCGCRMVSEAATGLAVASPKMADEQQASPGCVAE